MIPATFAPTGARVGGVMRSFLTVALLGGLAACAADADDDGLTNREEKELGLDPKVADSDGDGLVDGDEAAIGADPLQSDTDGDLLSDGEEAAAGSDPTLEDTDGDGYLDYDEVQEGHDPADRKDRIYRGNWPYNRDKDDLGSPEPTGVALQEGDTFFRHLGKDQFGDLVDTYDFAGDGMIVLDASATWCGPCQATASWLAFGAANDPYGYEQDYADVRQAIDRGRVHWITFMTDGDRGTATVPEVKEWDEDYPNDMVPVLTDPSNDVLYAINAEGQYLYWPSFVVLNKNMKVVYRGGGEDTIRFVQDNL